MYAVKCTVCVHKAYLILNIYPLMILYGTLDKPIHKKGMKYMIYLGILLVIIMLMP